MNENNGEQKGPLYGMLCSGPFCRAWRNLRFSLGRSCFSASGGKRCQKPLDKLLRGGVLYRKSRLHKKV